MPSPFERLFGFFRPEPVPTQSSKAKKEEDPGSFIAPAFFDSIPPNPKDLDFLKATTDGWAYACINAIAINVATAQLRLFKMTKKGPEEVDVHPLLDLMFKVNSFTTYYDHIYQTSVYLEAVGEAPWLIGRPSNNAKPDSMLLLRPDRVEIKFDQETIVGGYKYRRDDGKVLDIDHDNMIFLRNPHPTDAFRGHGTLQSASIAVDTERFAEKFNRNFFFNGARPDFVLKTKGKMNNKAVRRLRIMWDSLFKGVDNAHKMAVLDNGLEVDKLNFSQKDMEFFNQLKWSRDKILAIFGVPRHMLGISEDVNRANAKEAERVFMMYVIKPRLMRIQHQLNEFMAPQFGPEYYFQFDDPTPEDLKSKFEAYKTAIEAGIMVPNEAREELNLTPLRGGDSVYRPQNELPTLTKPEPKEVVDEEKSKKKGAWSYKAKNNAEARVIARMKKTIVSDKKKEKVAQSLTPVVKEMIKAQINASRKTKQTKEPDQPVEPVEEEKKKRLASTFKTREERFAYMDDIIAKYANHEQNILGKAKSAFTVQSKIVLQKMEEQDVIKSMIAEYQKLVATSEPTEEEKLEQKLREILRVIWNDDEMLKVFVENMDPAMMELFKEMVLHNEEFIRITIGEADFDFDVDEVALNLSLNLSGNVNETTLEAIRQQLANGMQFDESLDQLKERIKEVFDQANDVRAEMIARTETTRISNMASELVYKRAGIKFKEWVTARDDATCQWCEPMDGERIAVGEVFFKLGDTFEGNQGGTLEVNYSNVEGPPLHPNCRCGLGPVVVEELDE
jgi:HK97 family phage portal protein